MPTEEVSDETETIKEAENINPNSEKIVAIDESEYMEQLKDTISGQVGKNEKITDITLCVVNCTGIENLGAFFVVCRDVQKSPKIRHFRAIQKN